MYGTFFLFERLCFTSARRTRKTNKPKMTDTKSEDLVSELKNLPKRSSGVTIARINLLATRIVGRLLREAGIKEISPEQARILNILWEADVSGVDSIPIGILAGQTQLSKPTLTIILNRLEKNGYVSRSPSETDRRVVLIKRTGKDKYLEQVYASILGKIQEVCYKGFTPKETEQFRDYCERVLNNLIENFLEKRS
jgi:DNA-binding MarR family transcriptional regulator